MAQAVPNVVDFVPASQRPVLEIVTAFHCQSEEYADNSDNKGIKACLLNIRHHSLTAKPGMSSSRIMTYSSFSQQRPGAANRPRQAMAASYDRILFFGDVSSTSGQCFAMILQTSADSRHILQHARSNIAVGNVFIILEPNAVTNSLSLGLPVVSTENPLIPLIPRVTDIPPTPVRMPNMNETQFFAMHNTRLDMTSINVVSRNVSCRGTLCDRQSILSPSALGAGCGCLHVGKDAGAVMDIRVKFSVPPSFDESGEIAVPNVRSWRLTKLLVVVPNAPQMSELGCHRPKLALFRNAVSLMNHYVNRHGGWTVVGWHRRGSVVDHSSTENTDQVANMEQRLHISYLYPSNEDITNDENFKALRYDPTMAELDDVQDSSDTD